MKKLLSIVLALSLCLTAMMGCFVVSAAETNSVVVTGTTFNVGEATTATATIEIESTGFAAAMLDISFKGLDINAKALAEDETDTGVYEPDIAVTSTSSDVIVFSDNSINDAGFGDVTVANASDSIRLILDASGETLGYFEDATIVITFVAPAAGSYDVKVDAISAGTAGTYDIGTGAYTGGDETLIKNEDFTITNGAIVAHAHDYATPKYDENGHWTACACGATTEKVAHTLGEYVANEDGTTETATCTGCEYSVTRDIEVVVPECEHDWEFVTATAATGSDNSNNIENSKGSISLKCAKCEEEKTSEVNYSYYARTASTSINVESETLLNFNARYENDFTRILTIDKTDGAENVTELFIVLEQLRGEELIDTKVYTVSDTTDTIDSQSHKVYQATLGICGYAMNDDVKSTVYAYEANTKTWYSGLQVTESVRTLAESVLASTTNDLQKTMLVNLLNYGAAAQTNFVSKVPSLANVDLANIGIDSYQSYASTAKAFADTDFNIVSDAVPEYFVYAYGGNVESKVLIRPYIRLPKAYTDITSSDDVNALFPAESIKVVANYTDFLGNPVTETFTVGADTLEGEGLIAEGRISRYYFYLPMRPSDFRSDVTFQVYVNDEVSGPDSTYSLSNYLGYLASLTDEATVDMANKLMAFSDSAYDYLTSK